MALRAAEWPKDFVFSISTCCMLSSEDTVAGQDFAGPS